MLAASSHCVVLVLIKTSARYITHLALCMQLETKKQEKAHSQKRRLKRRPRRPLKTLHAGPNLFGFLGSFNRAKQQVEPIY